MRYAAKRSGDTVEGTSHIAPVIVLGSDHERVLRSIYSPGDSYRRTQAFRATADLVLRLKGTSVAWLADTTLVPRSGIRLMGGLARRSIRPNIGRSPQQRCGGSYGGYIFQHSANPVDLGIWMDAPSASVRALARRLLALEAASGAGGAHQHEAVRVCQKLRLSVTRFAGAEGFTSLLRRSLALARADVPSLKSVTLTPDGCLEGIEQLASDAPNDALEASVAITAHLLGLLVTFIGEPLTLRLVRDAWPDADFV